MREILCVCALTPFPAWLVCVRSYTASRPKSAGRQRNNSGGSDEKNSVALQATERKLGQWRAKFGSVLLEHGSELGACADPRQAVLLSTPCSLSQDRPALATANCIIIAQFPIENHSEQGQFAELPLKTIGDSAKFGRLLCNSQYRFGWSLDVNVFNQGRAIVLIRVWLGGWDCVCTYRDAGAEAATEAGTLLLLLHIIICECALGDASAAAATAFLPSANNRAATDGVELHCPAPHCRR
jgi:hypothetical protein